MYRYVQLFFQERMLQAEIKVFDHPDDLICACEKLRPHIYILDIVMPMVNGIQTARELKCYHLLSGKTISTSTPDTKCTGRDRFSG